MLEISPTIALSHIVIFRTIAITATVIISLLIVRHIDSTQCSSVNDSVHFDIGKHTNDRQEVNRMIRNKI